VTTTPSTALTRRIGLAAAREHCRTRQVLVAVMALVAIACRSSRPPPPPDDGCYLNQDPSGLLSKKGPLAMLTLSLHHRAAPAGEEAPPLNCTDIAVLAQEIHDRIESTDNLVIVVTNIPDTGEVCQPMLCNTVADCLRQNLGLQYKKTFLLSTVFNPQHPHNKSAILTTEDGHWRVVDQELMPFPSWTTLGDVDMDLSPPVDGAYPPDCPDSGPNVFRTFARYRIERRSAPHRRLSIYPIYLCVQNGRDGVSRAKTLRYALNLAQRDTWATIAPFVVGDWNLASRFTELGIPDLPECQNIETYADLVDCFGSTAKDGANAYAGRVNQFRWAAEYHMEIGLQHELRTRTNWITDTWGPSMAGAFKDRAPSCIGGFSAFRKPGGLIHVAQIFDYKRPLLVPRYIAFDPVPPGEVPDTWLHFSTVAHGASYVVYGIDPNAMPPPLLAASLFGNNVSLRSPLKLDPVDILADSPSVTHQCGAAVGTGRWRSSPSDPVNCQIADVPFQPPQWTGYQIGIFGSASPQTDLHSDRSAMPG